MELKVKSIRYFKTRRGVGYEAITDKGSIWNDGSGGDTYFEADHPKYHNHQFSHLTEDDLNKLLDEFEGVLP